MSESFMAAMARPAGMASAEIISLLEEAAWTIAVITWDGHISTVSHLFAAMLDRSADMLRGKAATTLVLEHEQDAFQTVLEQARTGHAPTPLQFHVSNPTHGLVNVEVKATLLPFDPERRIVLIVHPRAMLQRREQLITDFNQLAAKLLSLQSPEDVYRVTTQALQPLGMGMMVARHSIGEAALSIDYFGISETVIQRLNRAAKIDLMRLRIPANAPLFADVLTRNVPIFTNDFGALLNAILSPMSAAFTQTIIRVLDISGGILVPLLAGDHFRGVLLIWSYVLGSNEMPLIEAFAYQISAVLAQIHLRRQMEMQVQHLNSLATTAYAMTALGSLDAVLRVICLQAQELLNANCARIATRLPNTNLLKYSMATGDEADMFNNILEPLGHSICDAVWQSGQGRYVPNIQSEPDHYPSDQRVPISHSLLFQPLKHKNVLIGILIVGHHEIDHFRPSDLEYLAHYAEYAAVVITNAQLQHALQQSDADQQRQRSELTALLELGYAINQSFDLDLLLNDGLQVLEELHLANSAAVLLLNASANGLALHASRGISSMLIPALQFTSLNTIVGDILIEGQLRVLSARERIQLLEYYGVREHLHHQTSIFIPLIVGEKRLGVLGVGRRLDQPYAERELRLLDVLANQLAQAVAKAQMYQALEETAELNSKLYLEAETVRSYLNTLVHNTPDLLITLQRDMTMHVMNPERSWGGDTDFATQLEGGCFIDFVAPPVRAEVLSRWQNVLHGHTERMELTFTIDHSAIMNVQISATLIPEYGEVLMIMKDVTEQRRDEARIRQNEKLAALGQMVAGAAHELNNPLAVILGLTQLQITDELDPTMRADFERIERAALRARSIVQQLLTFARSQRPDPQPVELLPIIHETLNRLSTQIAEINAHIQIRVEPDLPAASGDPDQIEQVLFNIVHNGLQALAATPSDTLRTLELSARPTSTMLELNIKDNGPGIAPEHMGRLFEPFFTTQPVGKGTGLGLAIAHTIVQQHQGQIWISSQVGQGTTFTIQLPYTSNSPQPTSPTNTQRRLPPGLRILLVEDEELVRTVVMRVLLRYHYVVDAVESGAAALDAVQQQQYELIISDLQMPSIDGAALYEQIHQMYPSLRWLIMTGDTMGERSHAFLQHTGLPVLPKPFTHTQLLERVMECISDTR